MCTVAAAQMWLFENVQQRWLKKVFEGGGLFTSEITRNNCGVFMLPTRLVEAEIHTMFNRTSSATLNAPSTATELARDPDLGRNTPTAPFLACPAAESARKNPRQKAKKKQKCMFDI